MTEAMAPLAPAEMEAIRGRCRDSETFMPVYYGAADRKTIRFWIYCAQRDREQLLAELDRMQAELDEALGNTPPSPPNTGKLCCCGTGTDCPECMTGRCSQCPDNPERERDDDWDDDEGWEGEDD